MILITGSSGYLGKNFISSFGYKYDFATFSLQNNAMENINFSNIDTIIHCAALVHQKEHYDYDKYHKINTAYPVELAILAKQNGVKRFLFISTIAVYGDDHELINEKTECNPVTNYGKSKLHAEEQLMTLSDESFSVSIIRPPMIYGKNAPGNIDALIKITKKFPLIPFGGIENRRSFVYIDNLCCCIDKIISLSKTGVFLASDDVPISTSNLIKSIAIGLNRKIMLVKIPLLETFVKYFAPNMHHKLYGDLVIDNLNTRQILSYENPYSTEEGIKIMLDEI